MLRQITSNGKTIKYVKDKKEAQKYLPDGAPDKFEFVDGKSVFIYGEDKFEIFDADKEFGNYAGNVCPVCQTGTMSEFGGCATCSNCGAQLKCGL